MQRFSPILILLFLAGCTPPDDDLRAGLGAAFHDDGTLAMVGLGTFESTGGVWVSRVDRDGDPIWQTMFGTAGPEDLNDLHAAANGDTYVAGSIIDVDRCDDRQMLRGFVAELGEYGDLQRSRLAHRGPAEDCFRRTLAIRQVTTAGDYGVALAVEDAWERNASRGTTVFTFDDGGVKRSAEYDRRLVPRRLVGHRHGFIVAGDLPAASARDRGTSLTAFTPEGKVLWERRVGPATPLSRSMATASIVDGEVVVAMKPREGDDGATLLRYRWSDGHLLWSGRLTGRGLPRAIVDGPRKRWAVVRADVWDVEVVSFLRDSPQAAIAYTAEGVSNLAYRFSDVDAGEIVDRGQDNEVRWWRPDHGSDCDRPAGIVGVPRVEPAGELLELTRGRWSRANVQMSPWQVEVGRRHGSVPVQTCLGDQPSP